MTEENDLAYFKRMLAKANRAAEEGQHQATKAREDLRQEREVYVMESQTNHRLSLRVAELEQALRDAETEVLRVLEFCTPTLLEEVREVFADFCFFTPDDVAVTELEWATIKEGRP